MGEGRGSGCDSGDPDFDVGEFPACAFSCRVPKSDCGHLRVWHCADNVGFPFMSMAIDIALPSSS